MLAHQPETGWVHGSFSDSTFLTPYARMLRITERGLYCPAADFYIDPWLPVDRAVITHAHGDHARWGSRHYLASREGARVLRTRLGSDASY